MWIGRPFASARTCSFEFSPPFAARSAVRAPLLDRQASGRAVRLQIGRIDHRQFAILRSGRQFGHDCGKRAHAAQSLPLVVEGLRRTVVPQRMLPHQPIALYVDYSDQHPTFLNPRLASGLRKERLQSFDLRLRKPEQVTHNPSPL